MKKNMGFLFLIFYIILFSCNGTYRNQDYIKIVSSDNVVVFKGNKYTVIDNCLYILESNNLKKIASTVEKNGIWDYIGNVYSNDEYLIIINSSHLYFVDENIEVQYEFTEFKSSSMNWIYSNNKLFFLDDDINCRNLSYFDTQNRTKDTIIRSVKLNSIYSVESLLFYVDSEYDLNLIEDDMAYTLNSNEMIFYNLNYGLVNFETNDNNLYLNETCFKLNQSKKFFPRIECHGEYAYFALYDYEYKEDAYYICNYNNLEIYKYNLDKQTLTRLTQIESTSYVINYYPFVYCNDNKVYKENNIVVDLDIYNESEKISNESKKIYGIILYDEDIFVSRIN